jgi:hypothetical protein
MNIASAAFTATARAAKPRTDDTSPQSMDAMFECALCAAAEKPSMTIGDSARMSLPRDLDDAAWQNGAEEAEFSKAETVAVPAMPNGEIAMRFAAASAALLQAAPASETKPAERPVPARSAGESERERESTLAKLPSVMFAANEPERADAALRRATEKSAPQFGAAILQTPDKQIQAFSFGLPQTFVSQQQMPVFQRPAFEVSKADVANIDALRGTGGVANAQVGGTVSRLTLSVSPEGFGTVAVTCIRSPGGVELLITAEHPAVAEALADDPSALIEAVADLVQPGGDVQWRIVTDAASASPARPDGFGIAGQERSLQARQDGNHGMGRRAHEAFSDDQTAAGLAGEHTDIDTTNARIVI